MPDCALSSEFVACTIYCDETIKSFRRKELPVDQPECVETERDALMYVSVTGFDLLSFRISPSARGIVAILPEACTPGLARWGREEGKSFSDNQGPFQSN